MPVSNLQIIDYTEKSIALVGNTFDFKDRITELGGKYNSRLKIDNEITPGWIFPKTKKNTVQSFIDSNPTVSEISVVGVRHSPLISKSPERVERRVENTTLETSDNITISKAHYENLLRQFENLTTIVLELKNMMVTNNKTNQPEEVVYDGENEEDYPKPMVSLLHKK